MKFAGIEITAESIQATRQWFADNAQACIDEAVSGEVRVNDLESYIEWNKQRIVDALAGKGDYTFTFAQRAHYIQTGECLPLFRS
jgi:hypothetical protein